VATASRVGEEGEGFLEGLVHFGGERVFGEERGVPVRKRRRKRTGRREGGEGGGGERGGK